MPDNSPLKIISKNTLKNMKTSDIIDKLLIAENKLILEGHKLGAIGPNYMDTISKSIYKQILISNFRIFYLIGVCKGVRLHIHNPKQVDRLATSLHKADLQISNASCTQI